MVGRRKCKTNPMAFSMFVENIHLQHIEKILELKRKPAFKYYFGCKVADQEKKWTPFNLLQLLQYSDALLSCRSANKDGFCSSHDCYFCLINIKIFSKKYKSKIVSLICQFVLKPYLWDIDIPISKTLTREVFERS